METFWALLAGRLVSAVCQTLGQRWPRRILKTPLPRPRRLDRVRTQAWKEAVQAANKEGMWASD